MSDPQQLDELWQVKQQLLGEDSLGIRYLYCFDTSADKTAQLDFYSQLQQKNRDLDAPWSLECRTASRQDMYSLYGGLFFIGLFLSVLFLMGAVLIIYYKQISEGYEDRERFDILQKVGMSRAEVRATIRSQVLTVFFLPLVAAGVHMLAAFPILSQLLAVLNMYNTRLYLLCTAAVFAVFAILYVLIYAWTAKAYYRIVSPAQRGR